MIYYIDWMFDLLKEERKDAFSPFFEPAPLIWLLMNLKKSGFYKTKVDDTCRLIHSIGVDIFFEDGPNFDASDITITALKIYNLNL